MPLLTYLITLLLVKKEHLSGKKIVLDNLDLSEANNQKKLTQLINLLSSKTAPHLAKLQLRNCIVEKHSALNLILKTKATCIKLTDCTLSNEQATETPTFNNNTSCAKLVFSNIKNINYNFLETILNHIPQKQLIKFDISECNLENWYSGNLVKIKQLIQAKLILIVIWGDLLEAVDSNEKRSDAPLKSRPAQQTPSTIEIENPLSTSTDSDDNDRRKAQPPTRSENDASTDKRIQDKLGPNRARKTDTAPPQICWHTSTQLPKLTLFPSTSNVKKNSEKTTPATPSSETLSTPTSETSTMPRDTSPSNKRG